MSATRHKEYIDVVVHINPVGDMMPLFILYNQRKYAIDRVLEIKRAYSHTGGSGIRYRCRIQNQTRHLFFERNRWFIESEKE